MVASAVFITDLSGKMLISRNYRGDVPLNKAVERFTKYLLDTPDEQKKPIFYSDVSGEFLHEEDVGGTGIGGETYVYIAVSVHVFAASFVALEILTPPLVCRHSSPIFIYAP